MGCPQTTRSHRTLGPRMYKKIMVPVDLSHRERLEKAVATAADLSKCYKVPAEMVAVTATAPGSVARNPEELADKLARFAAAESAKHGVEFGSHAITSPDPAIDLDERLGREAHEIGADLIVKGPHVTGFADPLYAPTHGSLPSP